MSVALVTDEDVAGLGFYAEITVSDEPPNVSDNDLQCKYIPLNTILKSERFRAKQTVHDKCTVVCPSLNYVQVYILWRMLSRRALLVTSIVGVTGATYPERAFEYDDTYFRSSMGCEIQKSSY